MTAPEFKAPSPAKINRFLHVTGRREDGYHRLQSLFQFLDHGDLLTFRPDTSGTIRREDRHRFQLPQDDLCVRAATWLRESAERPDLGVEIVLEKNIPPGSGLGAGSSNAATTLLALNRLWSLDLSDDRLLEIARRLGADVPVFLHGEAAWAEGAGDELSACAVDEPWLALLIPRAPVSTAEAFNDPALRRDHAPVTREDFTSGRTGNDLEPVTFPQASCGSAGARLPGTVRACPHERNRRSGFRATGVACRCGTGCCGSTAAVPATGHPGAKPEPPG